MIRRERMSWMASALLAGVSLVAPNLALAQSGAGDGYLFHAPRATLALRLGVAQPSANSKVFSFTSDNLTLNRGDLLGISGAADLDVMITQRVAFQMGAAVSGREATSEYRNFIDNNNLPIEQRTQFLRVPLTAGLKVFLTAPGRSLGRFAWVPSKLVPYVAGGAGMMYYTFEQRGDFVDFQNFDVFPTTLESSGWTGMLYGSLGLNYSLSTRVGLVTEARYDHAQAYMSRDFVGFDQIDLSGMSFSTGLHFRF